MRVKKFEAKTMKEALRLVRTELGPEAVILSARDNRKNFGLVGEGSVEVTAAVSESTLHKKQFAESRMRGEDVERFRDAPARAQKRFIDKSVQRRFDERDADREREARARQAQAPRRAITSTNYVDIPDEESAATRASAQRAYGSPRPAVPAPARAQASMPRPQAPRVLATPPAAAPAEEPPQAAVPRSERALSHIRSAAREAWNSGLMADEERAHKGRVVGVFGRLISSAAKPEPRAQSPDPDDAFKAVPLARAREHVSAANATAPIEIQSLKAEIMRLQEMLGGIQKTSSAGFHPGADYGVPFDLSHAFQKLTDAGVGLEAAAEILQACQRSLDPLQLKKKPMVDAWVARYLLDATETVREPYRGRVHLFFGGPGSGKTSTLVKMASHLVVNEKRKVAILTTDTQKVGAVDQLKIYCQILNVPLAIVRNKEEWEWALAQLQAFDCVLADYPGLPLRDLDEIQRLKSMLPPESAQATRHLVISATSKDGDALEIERRYRAAAPSDLIFTNLDQSSQHGLIYNVQAKAKRPLHSFGFGARIPEDFEIASKERVLELLFKLSSQFASTNRAAQAGGNSRTEAV